MSARLLGLMIVVLGLTTLHAPASAQECTSSCASGRGICSMQARTARVACLKGCAAGDAQCHSACMTAVRSARAACKATRTDCTTACPGVPAGTTAPCVGGCGSALKACFGDAFAAGTSCVKDCKASGGQGFIPCLVQCAATMGSGREACFTAFQNCLSGCPLPTPPAQCSGPCNGGLCVIDPPCPPGGPCPEFPSRFGRCMSDSAGSCGCVPPSPPPTPKPQCAEATCGGDCTVGVPFPCPPGATCNGPEIPVLAGQCMTVAAGECACVPSKPTPRPTPTPQCGGPNCSGSCVVVPTCPAGTVCPQAEWVIRPGECAADSAGICECVPVTPTPGSCIPLFTAGCTQTSDCCDPCGNGNRAPCGVCINGMCDGAP